MTPIENMRKIKIAESNYFQSESLKKTSDVRFYKHIATNPKLVLDWFDNQELSEYDSKNVAAAFIFKLALLSNEQIDVVILAAIAKAINSQEEENIVNFSTYPILEDLEDEKNATISEFNQFISNVEKKMGHKFLFHYEKFTEWFFKEEVIFNTMYQMDPSLHVQEDLKRNIKSAAAKLLPKKDCLGELITETEPFILATVRLKERRLSIYAFPLPKDRTPLGKGKNGMVFKLISLTQNKPFACKVAFPKCEKYIINENLLLKKIQGYQTEQTKILSGLLFYPFIQILDEFLDADGCLNFVVEKYERDLFDVIHDRSFSVDNRFELLYQVLYIGAFCELIRYYNLDAKIENLVHKMTKDGHSRIVLIDPSNRFYDDLTFSERYFKDRMVRAVCIAPEELFAFQNTKLTEKQNEELHKKLAVYLYGSIAFVIFGFALPHSDGALPVEFPATEEVDPVKLTYFNNVLDTSKLAASTKEDILNLVLSMIKEDPKKRITCVEAFKKFNEMIVKDPHLNALFNKSKDFTGPWQAPPEKSDNK